MNYENLLAARTSNMKASAIRELLKLAASPHMISLGGGLPSPDSFPLDLLPELTEKVIKKYTVNINYPKLGYSRHSLYLDLKYVSTEEVEQYLKAITDIKEVSCCYMLREVSEWRIYLSVWTKTIERYDEIQTKIITRFKKHLKNYISFQRYFEKRFQNASG